MSKRTSWLNGCSAWALVGQTSPVEAQRVGVMERRRRPVYSVRRLSSERALDIVFRRCVLITRRPVSGVLLGEIKAGHRNECSASLAASSPNQIVWKCATAGILRTTEDNDLDEPVTCYDWLRHLKHAEKIMFELYLARWSRHWRKKHNLYN